MNPRVVAGGLAAIIFLLDRITKSWVEEHISPFGAIVVIPGFFNLIHTQNPGAAFSMFADWNADSRGLLLTGFSVVAMIVILALLWKSTKPGAPPAPVLAIGLGLILGGAFGNLWDRFVKGAVTDFLDFYYLNYHYATFNVADSAITVGAILLIVDMFWLEKRRRKAEA